MNVSKGLIVRAAAGRDCGGFFVILDVDENGFCLIADGKSRKLLSPKRKNPKHLKFTDVYADLNNITDKKLKKLLNEFSKNLT